MTTIQIERGSQRQTINGKPATEREIIVAANQIYGRPERFRCLDSDDRAGRWLYADLNDAVQGVTP